VTFPLPRVLYEKKKGESIYLTLRRSVNADIPISTGVSQGVLMIIKRAPDLRPLPRYLMDYLSLNTIPLSQSMIPGSMGSLLSTSFPVSVITSGRSSRNPAAPGRFMITAIICM
jgi:hypothetical protein